jgi:hypothetical protein
MDEEPTVEIQILQTKERERLVELFLNQLWLMRCIPEFGGDEKFLALDDRRDNFLQSGTDFVLVLIAHREIEMSITVSDGMLNLFGI